MEDSSLKDGCGTGKSVVLWGTGAIDDGMSGHLMEGAFFSLPLFAWVYHTKVTIC